MADAGGLRSLPLPRLLQILLNGPRTAEALPYRRNCQRSLCAVASVKQDRENDLFHIFDLEDRSERSANASSESRTFTLGNWRSHPEMEMALPLNPGGC